MAEGELSAKTLRQELLEDLQRGPYVWKGAKGTMTRELGNCKRRYLMRLL